MQRKRKENFYIHARTHPLAAKAGNLHMYIRFWFLFKISLYLNYAKNIKINAFIKKITTNDGVFSAYNNRMKYFM